MYVLCTHIQTARKEPDYTPVYHLFASTQKGCETNAQSIWGNEFCFVLFASKLKFEGFFSNFNFIFLLTSFIVINLFFYFHLSIWKQQGETREVCVCVCKCICGAYEKKRGENGVTRREKVPSGQENR